MLVKRRREEQQKEEEEENDGIREPPTKKKTLHSVQQESPPKQNKKKKVAKEEPLSTPLSPQNSSKKVARGWTPKDELAFFNGLLACSKSGKGLPKNVASYYDHIRNTMDNHFSNRQLSDKASRWKAKFRAAKDKMKANNLNFKSEHEAVMYNICNQLWGGLDEGGAGNEEIDEDRSVGGGDAENVRKASMNDKKEKKKKKKKQPVFPKEEDDMQKTEDQEDQGEKKEKEEDEDQGDQREKEEEEEEEGEDGSKRKEAVAMNMAQNVANDLAEPKTRKVVLMSPELYSQFREERDAMVAELKTAASMILKESELKKRAMIEDHFNSRTDHLQPPDNERINGFHSARGAPVLSRVKAEALEQKWYEQQVVEMEAYSKRLDLLQEECKIRLEELKAPVRIGGY